MDGNTVNSILKTLNDELDEIRPRMETHSRRGYLTILRLSKSLENYAKIISDAAQYISPDKANDVINAGTEYISILEEYGEAQEDMAGDTQAVTMIVARILGLLHTLSIIEDYGKTDDTSLGK